MEAQEMHIPVAVAHRNLQVYMDMGTENHNAHTCEVGSRPPVQIFFMGVCIQYGCGSGAMAMRSQSEFV